MRIHESLMKFISNRCRVGSRDPRRVPSGTHVTAEINICAGRSHCFTLALSSRVDTTAHGIQPLGLLLPVSEASIAAPLVPSGPCKDVQADTGTMCEEEGKGQEGEQGRGEGMTTDTLMKTCMAEKEACTAQLILFYF